VNTDGTREEVKKRLDEAKVGWRNFIDGSTDGPICTQWNVSGFPTVYLIDAKGVIRKKFLGVDEHELDREVQSLVAEAEGKKSE
jgi:hypothetical protein